MPLTTRSVRSGSTGRLRHATWIERASLVAVELHALSVLLHHRQFAQAARARRW